MLLAGTLSKQKALPNGAQDEGGKVERTGSEYHPPCGDLVRKKAERTRSEYHPPCGDPVRKKVEMAGIEPASERFGPRKSTSVAGCASHYGLLNRQNKTVASRRGPKAPLSRR